MSKQIGINIIADVPDLRVLEVASFKELAVGIKDLWGNPPQAWAIPIFSGVGPVFRCELDGKTNSALCWDGAQRTLPDLIAEIPRDGRGRDVYLVVDPHLSFINLDTIHIQDISTDLSSQACICNAEVQELLSQLICAAIRESGQRGNTTTDSRIAGVVIDCVDLWPMGATGERIEHTCFCEYCEKLLASKGVQTDVFRNFPNPWNICLQDSGTGIAHIDEIPFLSEQANLEDAADRLVKLSRLKGFTKVFEDQAESPNLKAIAKDLLEYVTAKNEMTRESIRAIFSPVRKSYPDVARIALVEGTTYDWTSGMFLESLDNTDDLEELWFDPSSSRSKTKNVKNRSYIWRRSRYTIDAFFESLTKSTDLFSRMSTGLSELAGAEVGRLIESRRHNAMAHEIMGALSLRLLPKDANRLGIVVPTMIDELLRDLAQKQLNRELKTASDLAPSRRAFDKRRSKSKD